MDNFVVHLNDIECRKSGRLGLEQVTYFQKHGNQIDESFDFPPDNEHKFSALYFHEKSIVGAQNFY